MGSFGQFSMIAGVEWGGEGGPETTGFWRLWENVSPHLTSLLEINVSFNFGAQTYQHGYLVTR